MPEIPDGNQSNVLGTSTHVGGLDVAREAVQQEIAARQDEATGVPATTEPTVVAPESAVDSRPGPDAVYGKEGIAYTPANRRVDFRYRVVDSDSLITSHRPDLTENPDYDQDLQGRQRDRAASAVQIADIAANLNPERLTDNTLASEGAPIIGPDMQVESGNGRTLGIMRAYDEGVPSAEAYKGHLVSSAERLGLDPAQVEAMDRPVLVRERTTPMTREERIAFAQEANAPSTDRMSDIELARRDAALMMQGGILHGFVPNDAGDLNTAANRPFVRDFVGLLPPSERGEMIDEYGGLSKRGLERAKNAMLTAAFGGSQASEAALQRIIEDPDSNIRNVGNALLSVSGRWSGMRAKIAAGQLYPLDIAEHVAGAASTLSSLRTQGISVADHLAQGSMFGDDAPDIQRTLLELMDRNKRSPKPIAELLNAYVSGVEAQGDPRQQTMFEESSPALSSEDILKAARRKIEGAQDEHARYEHGPTLGFDEQPAATTAGPAAAAADGTPTALAGSGEGIETDRGEGGKRPLPAAVSSGDHGTADADQAERLRLDAGAGAGAGAGAAALPPPPPGPPVPPTPPEGGSNEDDDDDDESGETGNHPPPPAKSRSTRRQPAAVSPEEQQSRARKTKAEAELAEARAQKAKAEAERARVLRDQTEAQQKERSERERLRTEKVREGTARHFDTSGGNVHERQEFIEGFLAEHIDDTNREELQGSLKNALVEADLATRSEIESATIDAAKSHMAPGPKEQKRQSAEQKRAEAARQKAAREDRASQFDDFYRANNPGPIDPAHYAEEKTLYTGEGEFATPAEKGRAAGVRARREQGTKRDADAAAKRARAEAEAREAQDKADRRAFVQSGFDADFQATGGFSEDYQRAWEEHATQQGVATEAEAARAAERARQSKFRSRASELRDSKMLENVRQAALKMQSIDEVFQEYQQKSPDEFTEAMFDADVKKRLIQKKLNIGGEEQDRLAELIRSHGLSADDEEGAKNRADYSMLEAKERLGFGPKVPEKESLFHSMDWAFGVGFGIMGTTQAEIKALNPWVSGREFLPDQVAEQATTGTFPLIGALAGTALGAKFGGPGGGLAGQFVGQSAGQTLEDLVDTYTEGHTYAQERAGQQASAGRESAGDVEEFTRALQAATGASREITDIFQTLARNGNIPLTPGAVTGIARLQGALGFAAPDVITGIAEGLGSAPELFPLLQRFGEKGELTPGEYRAGAEYFARQGDLSMATKFEAGLEATQKVATPTTVTGPLQAIAQSALESVGALWNVDYYNFKSYWGTMSGNDWKNYARSVDQDGKLGINPDKNPNRAEIEMWLTGKMPLWDKDGKLNNVSRPAPLAAAMAASVASYIMGAAAGTQLPGAATERVDVGALVANAKSDEFNTIRFGTQSDLAIAQLQRRMLEGGSYADVAQASRTIRAAHALSGAAYLSEIDSQNKVIDDPSAPPEFRNAAAQRVAQLELQRSKEQTEDAGVRRQVFEVHLDERQARFERSQAEGELAMSTSLYTGKTYEQMSRTEQQQERGLRAQAASLVNDALDPESPYGTADRQRMLVQARGLERAAVEKRGAFEWASAEQQIEHARTGAQVAQNIYRASVMTDDPDSAYNAARAAVNAFAAEIEKVTTALKNSPHLTDDQKNQLVELKSSLGLQMQQVAHDSLLQRYSDNISVKSSGASAAGLEAGITRMRQGSAAGDSIKQLGVSSEELFAAAQIAVDEAGQLTNPRERADAILKGMQLRRQAIDARIQEAPYNPSPDLAVQSEKDMGALRRAASSFLEPGNVAALRQKSLMDADAEVADYNRQIELIKTQNGGQIPAEMRGGVEQEKQRLLDQRAEIANSADEEFFSRLPSIVVGSTSFMERYLPSAAQSAAMMERSGQGSEAARNFGFFAHDSGERAVYELGDAFSAAGKTEAETHPGNLSEQALARAKSEQDQHHSLPLAHTTAALDQPQHLTLTGTLSLVDSDGTIRKATIHASGVQAVGRVGSGVGAHIGG